MDASQQALHRTVLAARQFVGFTKLDHLIHADAQGQTTCNLLTQLGEIEAELTRLASSASTSSTRLQAHTLHRAVTAAQSTLKLAWQRHHGRALMPTTQPATRLQRAPSLPA